MIYLKVYGKGCKQNERLTLVESVNLGALAGAISDVAVRASVAKYAYYLPVHLWDFGVRASGHLDVGDVIYIHCFDTCYFSKVFDKIEDRHGQLGDLVGWGRIRQQPWRNPVVLEPVVELVGLPPILDGLKEHVQLVDNFYRLPG